MTAKKKASRVDSPIISRHTPGKFGINEREEKMVEMLDFKRHAEKLLPIFERLDTGKIDTQQAIGELSSAALVKLIEHAFSGNSAQKISLEAVKQLLGMAGFTQVNKHVVGTVSADQSKEALLALIAGSSKQLKNDDIEIIDDRGEAEDDGSDTPK